MAKKRKGFEELIEEKGELPAVRYSRITLAIAKEGVGKGVERRNSFAVRTEKLPGLLPLFIFRQ
jgi:hypothetical protein